MAARGGHGTIEVMMGQPRLYRRVPGRFIAGIARGIAEHTRAPVWLVRLMFLVLFFVNGLGAVLYAAFWVIVPVLPADRGLRRSVQRLVLPAAALFAVIAVQLTIWAAVQTQNAVLVISVGVIAVGAAVVWHQADPDQQQRWGTRAPNVPLLGMVLGAGRTGVIFRVAAGVLAVVVGIIGIAAARGELSALRDGLFFGALALFGVAIVAGPWLWQQSESLRRERTERIRSQERAEIAAVVHDKVMHTLALIQRQSDNPREVIRLARGQERELRTWLYKPAASATQFLAAAVEAVTAEVEDTYAVTIETVVVGDAELDDRLAALTDASREALVNAAKHAGVTAISLYAEVEPSAVTVFVRDRGGGFDAEAIASDRHGVRGSIVERMRRHGGVASIRSSVGSGVGTEVMLTMPRREQEQR